MKIPSVGMPGAVQQYQRVRSRAETPSVGMETDRTEISDVAKSFGVVLKVAQQEEPDRAAKLEKLAASINDGTYHVEGKKVAERMLIGISKD